MLNDFSGELENVGRCDHSVTSEYLVFGPPGAGKTTSLARHVRRAVDEYGPGAILVTSFSRSAATELIGHDLPVIAENVGTLHSHCWRALGRPHIAEVHVGEWNLANPGLQVTLVSTQNTRMDGENEGEKEPDRAKQGDVLLQSLNRYRGLMVAPDKWPAEVWDFAVRWQRYKQSRRLLDFCDLIETGARDLVIAPGSPSVIVADEVQDLNPLQSQLIRNWGRKCAYFVRAGDDDQTIYSFAGATPETMLYPGIPANHKIILKQSHRLPEAVREFSEELIRRVSRRQEKIYAARPERGAVYWLPASYKCPEYAILVTATEHLARGKTIMFLASCSYMLQPLIQVLRKNAIPFHNPHRRSCGFWNPLRPGNRGSASSRIRALLAAHGEGRLWTYAEVESWAAWLIGTGTLKNAAPPSTDPAIAKQNVTIEDLAELFEPEAFATLRTAMSGDGQLLLNWWRARVHPDFYPRVQFPADIADRRGARSIIEVPQVVVGTIHSVKGGQADVVYLFPDLSRAGDANYQIAGSQRDSVTRLFYVGATRAREILYICGRESARSVVL
jgi:DNA helicase-2/ATP-dependent DNA helicase PcrA